MAEGSSRGGLFALLLVAAVAVGIWASYRLAPPAPDRPPQGLRSATPLAEPAPLRPFALVDHRGEAFTQASLEGGWTLISFGYTHCPDICPTTLQTLATVERQLEAGGTPPPRVVFVSLDPERDSLERLAGYVPYFSPRFTGVTADLEALRAFTGQVGVIFEKAGDGPDYLVNHSASMVLTDPAGRFAAVLSAPHDAANIAADFRAIAAP